MDGHAGYVPGSGEGAAAAAKQGLPRHPPGFAAPAPRQRGGYFAGTARTPKRRGVPLFAQGGRRHGLFLSAQGGAESADPLLHRYRGAGPGGADACGRLGGLSGRTARQCGKPHPAPERAGNPQPAQPVYGDARGLRRQHHDGGIHHPGRGAERFAGHRPDAKRQAPGSRRPHGVHHRGGA